MRKLFKERKLFKGGNYMRKYGMNGPLKMFDTNFVKTHMHKVSNYAAPPEIILTHYVIGSRGTEQRKLVRMPSSF